MASNKNVDGKGEVQERNIRRTRVIELFNSFILSNFMDTSFKERQQN